MNTGDNKSRMQFVERVGQLSSQFGDSISEKELQDAYTLRSELAHAQKFLFQLANVLPEKETCASLLQARKVVTQNALDLPAGPEVRRQF
jgi:hypothetical protein